MRPVCSSIGSGAASVYERDILAAGGHKILFFPKCHRVLSWSLDSFSSGGNMVWTVAGQTSERSAARKAQFHGLLYAIVWYLCTAFGILECLRFRGLDGIPGVVYGGVFSAAVCRNLFFCGKELAGKFRAPVSLECSLFYCDCAGAWPEAGAGPYGLFCGTCHMGLGVQPYAFYCGKYQLVLRILQCGHSGSGGGVS